MSLCFCEAHLCSVCVTLYVWCWRKSSVRKCMWIHGCIVWNVSVMFYTFLIDQIIDMI